MGINNSDSKLTSVILICHGSKSSRWRETFEKTADALKARLGENSVFLSYMEIWEPTLMQCVETAERLGHRSIHVLPLFMSGGGHVDNDIPKQIDSASSRFPHVTITQLPPLGEHPEVLDTIHDISKKALGAS